MTNPNNEIAARNLRSMTVAILWSNGERGTYEAHTIPDHIAIVWEWSARDMVPLADVASEIATHETRDRF